MSALFSSPPQPQQLNYEKLLKQELRGYGDTAQGFLGLNQRFDPQYGLLNLQGTQQQMFGTADQPGDIALTTQGKALGAQGNIANVSQYGGQAERAFLGANPYLASGLNTLQSGLQTSPILQQIQAQASDQLNQGGVLPPDQLRQIEQATRAKFAGMGLAGSNPDLAAEAVNTSALQQQRQAQAQGFALNAEQARQNQLANAQRSAQIFSTTMLDPWSTIVGGPSGTASSSGGSSGYPQLTGAGSSLFNPNNPFASDIYQANIQNQNAYGLGSFQNQQQQLGTALGALGSSTATAATIASLMGAFGFAAASDERLKEDITDTGRKTEEGIPIKRWRYKGGSEWFEGPIAQDVEEKKPEAVLKLGDLKLVDLTQFGKYYRPFQHFDFVRGEPIMEAA